MSSKRIFAALVTAAAVLLVAFTVTAGLSSLLFQTNDQLVAAILRGVAIGCLVALVIDLICLVLALGIDAVGRSDQPPDSDGS